MPKDEIEALKQKFVEQLSPVGIYLFGSFAEGRNTEGSDFDFYIIVDDSVKDIPAETIFPPWKTRFFGRECFCMESEVKKLAGLSSMFPR